MLCAKLKNCPVQTHSYWSCDIKWNNKQQNKSECWKSDGSLESCVLGNLLDTKPVRYLQSPWGLQSMSAPLVCVVMAHLDYNRHGRLDKASLVCFCALIHFFFLSFNSFSPFSADSPPTKLPVLCMCNRSVCVRSINGPIVWQLR